MSQPRARAPAAICLGLQGFNWEADHTGTKGPVEKSIAPEKAIPPMRMVELYLSSESHSYAQEGIFRSAGSVGMVNTSFG